MLDSTTKLKLSPSCSYLCLYHLQHASCYSPNHNTFLVIVPCLTCITLIKSIRQQIIVLKLTRTGNQHYDQFELNIKANMCIDHVLTLLNQSKPVKIWINSVFTSFSESKKLNFMFFQICVLCVIRCNDFLDMCIHNSYLVLVCLQQLFEHAFTFHMS